MTKDRWFEYIMLDAKSLGFEPIIMQPLILYLPIKNRSKWHEMTRNSAPTGKSQRFEFPIWC